MNLTPFPHQMTGARFLAERRVALLLDEMGLGKTAQVVLAADLIGARKILVICPAVVRVGWEDEFVTWQKIDRPIRAVEGRIRETPDPGVTVISHAALADAASVMALRAGAPYDLIVVDEIHEIRNWDAARTRAMYGENALYRCAPYFWGLTGTPVVNSAADLWPFAAGPLANQKSWWDWSMQFTVLKDAGNGDVRPIGLRQADVLADIFRSHVLRRTAESVGIRLPPLEVQDVMLPADPTALARAMAGLQQWDARRLTAALDDQDELKDSALASARRALGVAKAQALADHVRGILEAGEGPAVVFFQHTDVRKIAHAVLSTHAGYKVSWIDGSVTRTQLRAAREWFQAGRLDALLVQTQAGGVGLTLTRGCRAVIGELPWTAVALQQAIKRIHRLTQTRACRADVLRLKNCWLEDALATTVGRKHRASEDFLSRLTTNT